ncbi:unnamed protein product [marine sediment metagenome]|uniref:Uncharacterized protein n=1 Tax=marine sediment metagenome TaxID=412755 RepID=X0W0Y3_9ZZZZ
MIEKTLRPETIKLAISATCLTFCLGSLAIWAFIEWKKGRRG